MPKNTEFNIDQDTNNEEKSVFETDNVTNAEDSATSNSVPMDNAGQEIPIDIQPAPEKDPLEVAKQELAEMKDKYLRLYADFENFRKRTLKEKSELRAAAGEDTVKLILPIVDDFERAKVSFDSSTDIEALKEGVDLIYTKLYKALESKGLKPMQSKGETFDVELHESIAQFPAPSEDLKGKVIDEIEKGYYLNEKVIRYAKVIVGA